MKLTDAARFSLEELRRDFRDYLRQRGLKEWSYSEPLRQELIDARCASAGDVARWVREVHARLGQNGRESTYPEIAAKAALVLTAVACSLLDRQLASLAKRFLEEGGSTERMYRMRSDDGGRCGRQMEANAESIRSIGAFRGLRPHRPRKRGSAPGAPTASASQARQRSTTSLPLPAHLLLCDTAWMARCRGGSRR